ncbi:MAG TPA: non-homologous end-joining DNA ligase [Planctomycetota bacterium]|nr:non-homologous end-joining DNA ligase [Planctomycetota bacterium]
MATTTRARPTARKPTARRTATPRRLDVAGKARTTVNIGGKELTFSNLGKVLYPQTGFTKGDVIDYYLRVSEWMLPQVRHFPVTLKRYPNGVDQDFFYEKRCPVNGRPSWVETVHFTAKTSPIEFCVINNVQTLCWLANLAALELHILLAHGDAQDRPRMMVFDLDPGAPATIVDCARLAIEMRALLADLGLESLVKTSGSKGLHLYVPLNTPTTFDETKAFARAMAMTLERRFPDRVTSVMAKDQRPGKVFVDWSQNDRIKTTAAVYSLRARPTPTVSTPVTWKEVASAARSRSRGPDALSFTAPQVLARLRDHGDLFAPLLALRQELPSLQTA